MKKSEELYFGRKVDLMFVGCRKKVLGDVKTLNDIFDQACEIAMATVEKTCHHEFWNEGDINGYTIVKILSESDLASHTFPRKIEGRSVTISIYTCGYRADPEAPIKFLKKALGAKEAYKTPLLEFRPGGDGWIKV